MKTKNGSSARSVCVLLVLSTLPGLLPVLSFAQESTPRDVSQRVHTFYYPWYGNEETNGRFMGWKNADDGGTTYHPKLGCYSSNDPKVLAAHMRMMNRARIGVICTSWWGIGHYTDKAVPRLLDAAARHGIRVNFHLEPFPGRNAKTVREAIVYILDKYGSHPAFYRHGGDKGKPLFYLYDSYRQPAGEWAKVLSPQGELTIRGTRYDSILIMLWVCKHNEQRYILEGNFDGFYTYFATDGFVFGSTIRHWPDMMQWAREHDKIFIPCVGPGYDDTCIRTWNTENLRERDLGRYYSKEFEAAIDVKPPIIGITSFNEWYEGTQIEPAVPKQTELFTYADYESLRPEFYLDHTRYWAGKYEEKLAESKK